MEDYYFFTDEKKYVDWQNKEIRDWKIAYWIMKVVSYIFPLSRDIKIGINQGLEYCKKGYSHNKDIGGSCQSPYQDIIVNLPSIKRNARNEDLMENYLIIIIKHEDIHKVLNLVGNFDSKSHHYITRKLGYEIN